MKEFFETVYKKSKSGRGHAVDDILDVVGYLSKEKDFATMNTLFDIDLDRIDGSTMYSLVNWTSNYINVLPGYREFYRRAREQCARWGYPEERIKNLYDKLENGGHHLYDPNAPPYVPHEIRRAIDLNKRIEDAAAAGDKDLSIILEVYKSYSIRPKDREDEFHQLQRTLGDDELRKRTIKALRDMADLLDKTSSCWPGIFYAKLPDVPSLRANTIDGIEVIISYPWGG